MATQRREQPVITVLAGGVGASRFLQGLSRVVDQREITVISNTGDDVEMFGLHVSPDVDIVIYALANAVNPETGWGLQGDTLHVVQALRRYGYGDWFNLGDRDLATAIHRTRLLREGWPMHRIVADIARAWGLSVTILPMSDDPIETRITGPDGEIPFQDYMVRLKTGIEVRDVAFAGAEKAAPTPGVLDALKAAEVVVVAPSNPFVSIGPILAVPGIRATIEAASAVRVAISPIIAGKVVKGPAAQMLQSLGHEVSALGVARIYREFIDLMVIDEEDRGLAPAVEALGIACHITDTMMTSDERKAELAADVLAAAREFRRNHG
jgi:LPPG:FO 2-phospho-L-lactate transferase